MGAGQGMTPHGCCCCCCCCSAAAAALLLLLLLLLLLPLHSCCCHTGWSLAAGWSLATQAVIFEAFLKGKEEEDAAIAALQAEAGETEEDGGEAGDAPSTNTSWDWLIYLLILCNTVRASPCQCPLAGGRIVAPSRARPPPAC